MDTNAAVSSSYLSGAAVLNIGLGTNQAGSNRLTVAKRMAIMGKALSEVLEPGYIAHLNLVPKQVWVGEPLLVVSGVFKPDAALSTRLYEALIEAEQDCIAVYWLEGERGILFGPEARKWGEFNVNFFTFLGE
jgi:hypothetical protein